MAIDARTMLLLTLGIAVIAAGFLVLEWRVLRDKALLLWSFAFATITIGCSLTPLREAQLFLLGVWFPNGLLVVAHLFFLAGAARFAGYRPPWAWCALLLVWALPLAMSDSPDRTYLLGLLNAALVAIPPLQAARLLLTAPRKESASTRLGYVFLLHGAWYAIKTGLILVPGAYVDVTRYKGFVIQLSLFEGIMIEVLLALLMAASVRRRHEQAIVALAERDPLTAIFNRRAFESRAAAALDEIAARARSGALMLLDVDRFKAINDSLGHGFGDRVLIAFVDAVTPLLPDGAVLARLGGDEFALLLPGLAAAHASELGASLRSHFAKASGDLENAPRAATLSIGAVTFEGRASLTALLEAADGALYEAKRRGRDQLCATSLTLTRPRLKAA